jgi:hypothetical protein
MPVSLPPPANFRFLARYDAGLVVVATCAEQHFPDGSVTSLMKVRQFGEMLAKQIAARTGVFGHLAIFFHRTFGERPAALLACPLAAGPAPARRGRPPLGVAA